MVTNNFLLFKWRKDLIKNLIEEEAHSFYESVDTVQEGYPRSLLLQAVYSAKADVYEFINYIHSNYNLFSINRSDLSAEKIKKMFKFICFYDILHIMREEGDTSPYKNKKLEESLFDGICCDTQEKSLFEYYIKRFDIDKARFELEFANDFANELFGNEKLNPPTLDFINNFFYNSFKNFVLSCRLYVAGF